MKLFDLFKKQKKMTIKDQYFPVLAKMWVCVFNFCPWDVERHDVVFKKVNIIKASADEKGIFVESDEIDPFIKHGKEHLSGYIDHITSSWHWVGFFETMEEAEKAYNELMTKWIRVIETKMVPEETKMVKED